MYSLLRAGSTRKIGSLQLDGFHLISSLVIGKYIYEFNMPFI